MSDNASAPAFPQGIAVSPAGDVYISKEFLIDGEGPSAGGLTKRELAAMMAMQGLLASDLVLTYKDAADNAVAYADALLAALRENGDE